MSIHPETYAFLLEHDYKHVRKWVLTCELDAAIKDRLSLLEDNRELLAAWVHHNERNQKMVRSKCGINKLLIGLVTFWDQFQECRRF